jgi:outer membrane protein assembly factor BamA
MIYKQLHIFINKQTILFSLAIALFSSCSVTKKLPVGESLYVGATVKVIADSTVSKTEIKNIETKLVEFSRPKPNSSLLGFPYKLWFYNLFGEPKKEKGFKYAFRKRLGEPPILASKSVTLANAKQIAVLLNNEGYFQSTASGELIEKNRKSTANYTVNLKPRFYIDSVKYFKDSSALGKAFNNFNTRSLIKSGSPYSFEQILAERNRISTILKQRGFYYFQPDYIVVLADTTLGNNKVNLSVEIKPTTSQTAQKQYKIRDVHVLADYGEVSMADTMLGRSREILFDGIRINDKTGSFNPKVFSEAIAFREGIRYSTRLQDISLSRLINLNGNFKFVKNTFELVPSSDSALLDANYYLTPVKAKSITAEINGTTKSNNVTGTNLSFTWTNKNTFGGAELLKLSATTGLDFQVGGISQTLGAINTNRYAFETSLSIPRFLIPFAKVNPVKNQALPKTNITLAYDLYKRGGYYDLASLRGSFAYAWKQNNALEHSLTPFSINLIRASNISEAFVDDILRSDNPATFFQILENSLIMSTSYNLSYTPSNPNSKHFFAASGGIEMAGNLASLLSKLNKKSDTTNSLFGVSYAQFARFDGELRYTYSVNNRLKLANRLVIGYGLPHGNSYTLPTTKQYSAGGNNSIRAFVARSIGPGSYLATGDIRNQLLGSQMGDIKLEFNTEIRAKFNKYINGAIFLDAGNVWMQSDEFSYGENAVFNKEFYKQLAVGTGIGLRLDFTYLILRFDLATPVVKPYLEEGKRWVLKDFNLGNKQWRSENLVLNIAVGYPF